MKRPRQGIRSTSRVPPVPSPSVVRSRIVPDEMHPTAHTHLHVMDNDGKNSEDSIPIHVPHINVIESDDDSNGNVFVFAAFADKQMAHYIPISPVHSLSCPLREMFVSL
jgi:hypothetical protein